MGKQFSNLLWATLASLALAGAPACVGTAPNDGGGSDDDDDGDDPGEDPGDDPGDDPGEDPIQIMLSGSVVDYQEGISNQVGDPLAGAELATVGLSPEFTATAGGEGAYELGALPPGSVFYVDAEPGAIVNYRPTRNALITVAEAPLAHDLYLVSEAYVTMNYASTQATPVADTGMVIVDMRRNNGEPFAAGEVALADVSLVDALGEPVAGVSGPYFISNGNVMDPELLTNVTAFQVTRVGFLNVPAGDHTFNLVYLDGQEVEQTMVADIKVVAAGATLQRTGGVAGGGGDGGGGGGGGGGGETTLAFVTDIYPDLQRASQGGLSCAACHTDGGQMAALQYDLPAADVHAALIARLGVINLETPETSGLLTNPLYEAPADHPNATFANIDSLVYQKWMLWISQGAPLEAQPLPPP